MKPITLTREEQLALYIDAVTGTAPFIPVDLASLMYHYHNVLEDLIDVLKHPEYVIAYNKALDKLSSLSRSFLLEAKFHEGIPIQKELF